MSFDFDCENELSTQACQYVTRDYACQIKNLHQVAALKTLFEKYKPSYYPDSYDKETILRIDNEISVKALDYVRVSYAYKIKNPHQVAALKTLFEKYKPSYYPNSYDQEAILRIDRQCMVDLIQSIGLFRASRSSCLDNSPNLDSDL